MELQMKVTKSGRAIFAQKLRGGFVFLKFREDLGSFSPISTQRLVLIETSAMYFDEEDGHKYSLMNYLRGRTPIGILSSVWEKKVKKFLDTYSKVKSLGHTISLS